MLQCSLDYILESYWDLILESSFILSLDSCLNSIQDTSLQTS